MLSSTTSIEFRLQKRWRIEFFSTWIKRFASYGSHMLSILCTVMPLSMSSEGTATCIGGGPGMWDGPTLAGVGATLPGGGGFRRERESAGAGQSCSRTPQHLLQVRGLHSFICVPPLPPDSPCEGIHFYNCAYDEKSQKQGKMTFAPVKIWEQKTW